jgi:hypothetical protein
MRAALTLARECRPDLIGLRLDWRSWWSGSGGMGERMTAVRTESGRVRQFAFTLRAGGGQVSHDLLDRARIEGFQ